jgi:predicted dehydrogenase
MKNVTEKYSVLIIGAGKIGALFDTPGSAVVLTHAHAFSKHDGFSLLGFWDTDKMAAERATQVWGGEAFTSLEDAFNSYAIDVAVVAAPDEFHYPLLKELTRFTPRLVFTEKPLTKTVSEAQETISIYRDRQITLGVNYTRRFVSEFICLKGQIESGVFGRFLTGIGYYGKGTLHNGSHMIDLLRFLFGDITETLTISRINDFYDDDPSCSALLTLAQGETFTMHAVDCRSFTIFELDLLFEQRRVRIVDAGFRIELYDVRESNIFAGYRNLNHSETLETGLGRAFATAAECIYAHLLTGASLPCTGEDGLRAQQICVAIQGSQQ